MVTVSMNIVGAIRCEDCNLWNVFPTTFERMRDYEYDVEKFCDFIGIPYLSVQVEEFLIQNSKMVEMMCCIKCNKMYVRVN